MSKAFTKDDAEDPGVERPTPRRAPGDKRPITPEGLRALEQELERLISDERPRLQRLPPIESAGPLRDLETRARLLLATLESVTVFEPKPQTPPRASFGLWVALTDEDGLLSTYRLVGPDEADPKAGRLSVQSPLGQALLGKGIGEAVEVERPKGTVEYEVHDIRVGPLAD